MLRLDRIDKRPAGAAVLSGVSLDVTAGESVLVTGTTRATSALLRIAATLIPPDSGLVRIDGIDARRDPYGARQRVAYVGPGALPDAPGMQLRDLWRTVRAGRAATGTGAHYCAVLDHAGVGASHLVSTLEPAVLQAFAIALALDSSVPLVLLDDPLAVLDDQWAARANDWIAIASQAGTAVVMTSSDASPVESGCARIVHLAS
jgi:ABC-type multidrug transport system ATPase subunit